MKKFTVKENSTLKEFTDSTYPQGSFYFNALLKRGDIRVNGEKQRKNLAVSAGDEVTYFTSPAQEDKPSHTVIYGDNNILVADKFSGVSSEALFCELGESQAVFPVHRLDRNTCGIIVVAKSEGVKERLVRAFKERAVEKTYLCFAKTAFKEPRALLTAYADKNSEAGRVRVYASSAQDRVKMVTEYSVEKQYGDYALVKVVLHTGKTHQIRAHLAFIGCPVLGDEKYGDFALNKKYGATRQILVSKSIAFQLDGEVAYLSGKTFTSNFFPALPQKN